VRVQQELSAPALCELVFYDPPGPLDVQSALGPGTALQVEVTGHTPPLFGGEVTAVQYVYGPSGAKQVRVRAYDLLHRLAKRQPVRVHVQVGLRDLARELTADLGVSVEAQSDGPLWEHLYQWRQSDLGLLVEAARRAGFYLALREGVLHLLTLEGTGAALPLSLGGSLLEARIEVNGDPACRTVEVAGWNALLAERHEGKASMARIARPQQAEVSPAALGADGRKALANEAVRDDRHAEVLAQAELDARAAREVTLWGVAVGDPRLRPGARVEVSGVARGVAGRYALTRVVHTIDARLGFVTEVSTDPPALASGAGGTTATLGATLGVVSQVDDPGGLGRVKVALPTYGEVETDWMGVLCVAAGPGKGLVALPDAGDKVLVLLSHDDPGQGIVIGGLYGTDPPPDPGVEGGAVRRYTLRTPGGQYMQLDDERRTVRLQDAGGSYLQLSPEGVVLHSRVALELDAPGQAVTIRGKTVDFEQG
jgi:phage protein D/phage baseplate assembly protein gpV